MGLGNDGQRQSRGVANGPIIGTGGEAESTHLRRNRDQISRTSEQSRQAERARLHPSGSGKVQVSGHGRGSHSSDRRPVALRRSGQEPHDRPQENSRSSSTCRCPTFSLSPTERPAAPSGSLLSRETRPPTALSTPAPTSATLHPGGSGTTAPRCSAGSGARIYAVSLTTSPALCAARFTNLSEIGNNNFILFSSGSHEASILSACFV